MTGRTKAERLPLSAGMRLLIALVAGVVVGGLVARSGEPPLAVLAGIVAVHFVLLTLGWLILWPMDAASTLASITRQDYRPAAQEFLIVTISVSGLVGIAILGAMGHTRTGLVAALLALVGIFLAWGSLHLMYAAHYAHQYYANLDGSGIDFNDNEAPMFRDFFYFSYNLGMTYQVSDTAVTSPQIRSVVLRHSLLSYVFGVVVLATTVNLVASIAIT